MTQQPAGTGAPGWHPDPWFTGQRRFYDGARWTADVFADSGLGLAVTPRGSYGPPPTEPAASAPPAPEWAAYAPPPPPQAAAAWPTAPVAAPPSSRRGLAWAIAAVAVAVVLALVGWALIPRDGRTSATPSPSPTAPSPAPSSPGPASPSPTAPSTPAPSSPAPSQADLELANLVVRQRDVPPNYLVVLIPGGDQAAGEVTLDLCDGTYPSEDLRKARLQVVALDGGANGTLSTEAVRYGSEADTAQAFEEVRAVAAACTAKESTDPQTGVVTTETVTDGADAGWKSTDGVERLAYTVKRTADDGSSDSTVVVYLRRGPLLLGLYFLQPEGEQMAVEGRTSIPAIVDLFEKRLLDPPTDPPDPIPSSPGGGGSGDGGGLPA